MSGRFANARAAQTDGGARRAPAGRSRVATNAQATHRSFALKDAHVAIDTIGKARGVGLVGAGSARKCGAAPAPLAASGAGRANADGSGRTSTGAGDGRPPSTSIASASAAASAAASPGGAAGATASR